MKLDDRDEVNAGFKFNDWEMRGVPLRIEIGPRDVEQNAVVFARRDIPGKEGKTFGVPVAGIAEARSEMLTTIQAAMLQRATDVPRAEHAHGRGATTSSSRCWKRTGGFIRVHWAGSQRGRGSHQGRDQGDHPLLPVRRSGSVEGSASTPGGRRSRWQCSRGLTSRVRR